MKLSVRQEPRFVFEFSGVEGTSLLKVLRIAQQLLEGGPLEDAHERGALAFCKMAVPELSKRGILDTHPEIEKTYGAPAEPKPAPRPAPRKPSVPEEDTLASLINESQGV